MIGKILVPVGILIGVATAVTLGIKIKQTIDDRNEIVKEAEDEQNGDAVCVTIKKTGSDEREIRRSIERLKFALANAVPGTPEYDSYSTELTKAYELQQKWKDSRFFIKPEVLIPILVIGGIAFFAICLDQENPKALKIAQFIIRLFKW